MPSWLINPYDISFCSMPNGKLCRLGCGAFGTVSSLAPLGMLDRACRPQVVFQQLQPLPVPTRLQIACVQHSLRSGM